LRHLSALEEHDLMGLGVEAERRTLLERFVEKRDSARRGVNKT
jgi:hypothetical protein